MKSKFLIAGAIALSLAGCKPDANKTPDTGNTTNTVLPSNSAWAEKVSNTPEGGTVMGNPDAKVKLVEYGALACPFCARFSGESAEPLKALVNKGTLSFEFRPFLVHGVLDIPPTLIARCNGAPATFGLMEQLFANQQGWVTKMDEAMRKPESGYDKMQAAAQVKFLADAGEMVAFAQKRGVPAAKANACIGDSKEIDRLLEITNKAMKELKVGGTPSFFIGGTKLDGVDTWAKLKPKLEEAGA